MIGLNSMPTFCRSRCDQSLCRATRAGSDSAFSCMAPMFRLLLNLPGFFPPASRLGRTGQSPSSKRLISADAPALARGSSRTCEFAFAAIDVLCHVTQNPPRISAHRFVCPCRQQRELGDDDQPCPINLPKGVQAQVNRASPPYREIAFTGPDTAPLHQMPRIPHRKSRS